MTLDHMQQVFTLGRCLTHPDAIPSELRGYILEPGNPYRPVRFPDIRPAAGLTARAILDPSTTDGLRRYTAWIIAMSNQTDLYLTELDPTCSMCPNHWINKDGPIARPFLQCAIIVPAANAGEENQPRPVQLPAGDVSEGACCNCVMVDTIDDCDCNNRYWKE
jgi:hypothetical protein